MLAILQEGPRSGLSLLFQGLTVVDVYQMGLGFVLGSVTTVVLLLILDIMQEVRHRRGK